MTTRQACDQIVEQVHEIRALRERVDTLAVMIAEAIEERDSYRRVAAAAIHHAHDLNRRVAQLERQNIQLRDEHRLSQRMAA